MDTQLASPSLQSSEKSTNVRSPAAAGPGALLRGAFGTLSVVAPSLAARWAERLFFTPRRHAASARTRAALASGQPFTVHSDGHELCCWSWGDPGRPIVYLMHGWSGRAAQLTGFAPPLLAAGYRVVAFDAPAHGDSAGERTSLIDFADGLRAVVAHTGPAHAVIGHSLGGAATALAARQGLVAGRLVLLGTIAEPARQFRRFLRLAGVPRGRRAAVAADLERRNAFRWTDLSLLEMAPGMRTPLLVVHDEDDAEVPWRDGAAIAAAWPAATLLSTRGLGHRKILRDAEVIASVTAFVTGGETPTCSCAACSLDADLFYRERRAVHA